ncbi:hypothetical protein LSCM4_04343 [Leishmania orientalis]|uniref:Uncharacterized protein n=1 Tax=Leishmania orientalis TaxID=2249476 RepID=A0A836KK14_9TRYP|nr:hypothetical protein LSCM4_04343 [Leishmania orientalis]
MNTKIVMECTASSQTAGQQAVTRVEAVVAAVTLPLMRMPPRSTTEQREALLEQLYTDYAELQSQREEINNRKRVMDFDMYQSHQQDIHDVLFANVDAADGALGDWDTWERVEAVVKRYAYGRPRHTAQEKKEMSAMQSRNDALNEVLQEKAATVQRLTESLDAAQEELAGVRKLLQLKDNEIRMLSNQNKTAKVQLSCIERECATLRGFDSEAPSSLKDDLRFLIEANKELERQNLELRRCLNAHDDSAAVACTHRAFLEEKAIVPSSIEDDVGEATVPGVTDDTLDPCMEDDAYRHRLLHQNIPLCGMFIDAKRNIDQLKRRVEAEVGCAMEMLDRDALIADKMLSLPVDRGGAQGPPPMGSGAFVSYATYQSANEMQPWLTRPPVVSAPPLPTFASVSVAPQPRASADAVGGAEKAAPAPTATPSLPAAASEPGQQHDRRRDRKVRSTLHASHSKKNAAATGAAAAPATTSKATAAASALPSGKSDASDEPRGGRTIITTAAPAFVQLKNAVLQCAELSRANALRRELLHTQWLRQQLQEERERVVSLKALQSHPSVQDAIANAHGASGPSVECENAADTNEVQLVPSAAAKMDMAFDETLCHRESCSSTSSAHRLRDRVHESWPPTGDPDWDSGDVEGYGRGGALDTGRLAMSPSPPLGLPSRELSVQSPLTRRNLPAQLLAVKEGCSDTGSIPRDSAALQLLTLRSEAPAFALDDEATAARLRAQGSEGVGGVVCASRLALHASRLRQQVQQLAVDAAALRNEVHDALHTFGTLLAQQQQYLHTPEAEAIRAARAATQEALEEAAVARAARLLEEKFNLKLAQDCYAASTAPLPDTATDEEWLAHELRLAAIAMVRETARSRAIGANGSRGYDAGAASEAAASPILQHCLFTEAQEDGAGRAHRFFDDDILRRIQSLPKGTFGTAKRWNASRVGCRGGTHLGREDADMDATPPRGHGACAGKRFSGCAPRPMQWYWKASGAFSAPLTGGAPRWPLVEPQLPVGGLGAASFGMPTPSPRRAAPADIESIRPTVLRYDFGSAGRQAQRQVNAQMKRGAAYICGQGFYDFVREYVVPIISTAARVTDGAVMDAALRAAVRELREKARRRCKRGVRLLLDRVANNIRTRHLLRSGVFHGEGFVSYVGVLYNKWRNMLEQERRLMRTEQRYGHSALLSLMHLRAPGSDALAGTLPFLKFAARAPEGGVLGDGYAPPQRQLQKSSYHFDRVNFESK